METGTNRPTEHALHWSKGIDSALLILLLTASSYAIAFEYQIGYLSHFGLPPDLAEVGVREILISAVAVFLSTLTVFWLVASILDMLPKSVREWPPLVRRRVFSLVLLLLFVVIILGRLHYSATTIAIALALPAVMLLGELLMPLLGYRQIPTYAGKLEASVKSDLAKDRASDNMMLAIVKTATPGIAALFGLSVAAGIFAFAVGKSEAYDQTQFLVAQEDEQPCAVVRVLSIGMLCAMFDPKMHRATGAYKLLRPDSVRLNLAKTGRLGEPEATPLKPPVSNPGGGGGWRSDWR